MERIGVASRGIVREELTRYNYQEWKILMKNYLRGKNLWDVVETGSASTPIDAQKDAKALYIIQLSCAPDIFDQIKHFQTAHIAWNHLAKVCRSEFNVNETHTGVVSHNVREHKDLHKFVEKGNWEGASLYLRDQPNAIFWTSSSGRTVLHVATIKGHMTIVERLVYLGKKQLIEMQDEDGNTAIALAAGYTGNINIAKFLVKDDKKVLGIENKEGEIPLLMAANSGCKTMTRFLFFQTPRHVMDDQSSHNRVLLLERCIQAHIFDVALTLLESYEELPIESLRILLDLARVSFPYISVSPRRAIVLSLNSGTLVDIILAIMHMFRKFVESTMDSCGLKSKNRQSVLEDKNKFLQILRYYKNNVRKLNSSELREALVYDAMLEAAKHGNVRFLNAMRKANHELLWAVDNHGRDIFSYAVLHRKGNVFQFMRTHRDIINYRTDMFGNNLLHLAAHLGPLSDINRRSIGAWQMKNEIEWFKEVEEVVPVKCREAKNEEGKTPEEIFIETHNELVKDGEKLIKETAGTFAIVGVLVITNNHVCCNLHCPRGSPSRHWNADSDKG